MSTAEKQILGEFIQLYRNLRCLWDPREVLYSNKEAREKAYEVLLEKYKSYQEDAVIMDVKKRIENMRCAYRREHKKVLQSRIGNSRPHHTPTLWYYEHFLFLNEIGDQNSSSHLEEQMKTEYEDEEEETPIPKKAGGKSGKRRRGSDHYGSVVPTIYLPELNDTDGIDHDDELSYSQEENSHTKTTGFATESEAFGTTIGLQLNELDPFQRLIAEKLISDVIFHGRLKKLTVDSSINNLLD